ncbi:LytTR family transcriptional regulator [Clostridium niameyense]|uniref:LytTR family transcriptional regulator n=1 Tax=Clostridium niameyense TaxID=1622073 RepID=A0A6M0RA01_9CLOT|nr:LytTR family DNA-binding domain-containing protein [Clostridium niameyense]NEZ47016.1 LytTR family transcriptional regulator [Clostridium niameyense]
MQVEIKIEENCQDPKIIILTNKITEEVNEIIKKLSYTKPETIAGFKGDTLQIINPDDIIRIFTSNQKVYAITDEGEFIVKLRLYEFEERLDKSTFVRISNSEIINLKKVKNMDLSFSGTICVKLSGNITTYVSRRYVSKIKKTLGI